MWHAHFVFLKNSVGIILSHELYRYVIFQTLSSSVPSLYYINLTAILAGNTCFQM